ncbi:hypothetical protein GCM10007425_31180 [Lysinibacillus alkalisoli]|uniref:Uncharacterized protein n=1 Tax=Lysinibacillus alkalisoli TaxID=1911548 RepID=A0A917GB30_9BACI|nr:hypothetical protein [Lysinibacillus alkalisoli]GGG34224.1 hypothetical protein GCM10007425_31180 [Lysinibacillus alkalisoli]
MFEVDINTLFTSKKYKLSEKRLFLTAVVQKTIYSKNIFPKNSDLYNYIYLFESLYKLDEKDKFKPYLYDSRTQLAARICRLIISKDDLEVEKELMEFHAKLYGADSLSNTDKKIKKDNNSSLLKDIINNRNREE